MTHTPEEFEAILTNADFSDLVIHCDECSGSLQYRDAVWDGGACYHPTCYAHIVEENNV